MSVDTTNTTTNTEDNAQSQANYTFLTYPFKHDHTELENVYDFSNKKLTQNKNKIDFVVTHGNCMDGFMSATIVRMYLESIGVDLSTVTFYNAYHGNDFANLVEMMQDKHVVICDFSFPVFIFEKMIKATNGNILILDHHKTAQKMLQTVPSEYVTFDMNHSGAFITWTYFFGFNNVPKAVLYVEDNDIWTKALPQTREFTAFVFAHEPKFDFEEYKKLFDDRYLVEQVFPQGTGMVLQNDATIEQITKKTVPHFVQVGGRYYMIACINSAGTLRSEIGNYVLSLFKNANFSMVYAHDPYTNVTSISYRSLDDRSDTTPIAKINGGGGHRNAAGAGINHIVTAPPGRIIDPYRAYYMLDSVYTVEIAGKKFLFLNSSSTQKHLARYLMQERFFDVKDASDDGTQKNKKRIEAGLPGYQEGLYVMRNRTNNPELDEVYSGAVIWSYDGLTCRYKMYVKYLPGLFVQETVAMLATETITLRDLKDNLYELSHGSTFTAESIILSMMEQPTTVQHKETIDP